MAPSLVEGTTSTIVTDASLGAGDGASLEGDAGAELRELRELMDSTLDAGDTDLRRFLDEEDARFFSVEYDLYGGLPLRFAPR